MDLLFKSSIAFLYFINLPRIYGIPTCLPGGPLITTALPYRIDFPRKITSIFAPYTVTEDLRSTTVCKTFPGWSPTNKEWDEKMNPLNLTLCSKDFGGQGNCLYYVIEGILKENKYKIGKFDLNRKDLSPGILASLKGMNFDKDSYFTIKDLRKLAALMFVGINPHIEEAQKYFDEKELISRVRSVSLSMDTSYDIKWNPQDCLRRLESAQNNSMEVAKTIFDKISSTSPVNCWGSGDDLYSIANLLNIDVLLFHRNKATLQHIPSDQKRPVCTITVYYYEMVHFQSAGVVLNNVNTHTRKITNAYKHFELDPTLFALLPKTSAS